MPDCGVTEFMRGGMIAEAHVTASTITDSRVTSTDLESCNISKLASIDADSAQAIADAIAQLPEGMLAELAKAVANAMPNAPLADSPEVTTESALPASIAGNRELLLGKPDAWLGYQDFVIPGFKAAK